MTEPSRRRDVERAERRSFEALEERHFLNGEWAELVALYEWRLEEPALRADGALRARVLFRLAQILEERRGDVEAALERYLEVVRIDSAFRPALARLRRLHAARGSSELALQVAELEEPLEMRAAERATFHTEVGQLWAGPMHDPAQALEQFEKALACAPDLEPAARGRADALLALGRASEAARAYGDLLERARGRERARLGVVLARLQEGPLGEEERAFASYRRALTDDPDSREALEGLATLAARSERWPLLAELLERRFACAEGAEALEAIALEAARLEQRRLGRPEAAAGWYRRVLEFDPGHLEALLGLAQSAGATGDLEEEVLCLERALARDRSAVPAPALLEAAKRAESRDEWERALVLARAAQQSEPDDPWVLEALTRSLRRLGRPEELALVLERQVALSPDDPERAAAWLEELGHLHEEPLADAQAALEAYQRAFALHPQSPELGAQIERLLQKSGDREGLRAHLERASSLGSERDRTRVLSALGALLAEGFGDLEGAARCYEAALEREPAHEPALHGMEQVAIALGDDAKLVLAYERAAARTSNPEEVVRLAVELVSILERGDRVEEALRWGQRLLAASPESAWALSACARLHQRLGETREQIAMLERLESLQPDGERAETRRCLARTFAALADDEAAIRWGQAALEIEPGHGPTLEALLEPLERTGSFRELAEVYRTLAERAEPQQRPRWLEAQATLLADTLGAPDEAIAVLRELVADEAAPARAADRLELLLEQQDRLDELVEQLEARRARTEDADLRARLALRRANLLLGRLGRAREAAASYRSILEREPGCEEAARGLEQCLRVEGDFEGLIEILERRQAGAADVATRERIALECAELLDAQLGENEAAQRRYRCLADSASDPGVRDQARRRLEALLERRGDWRALHQHLESQLASAGAERALACRERLARIAAEGLREPDTAVRHLEAAVVLAPERPDLWSRLGALYEELGRTDDLLRVLEAELDAAPPSERELALRARAGALRAQRPEGDYLAEAHFRRVLALCPTHAGAAAFLSERFEVEGRCAELADLLGARLAHLEALEPGSPSVISLRLRLAALRRDQLEDAEGAIAALEPALRASGALATLAEPLAELYQATGRSETLAALCLAMVQSSQMPAERGAWAARLGEALVASGREEEATHAFHQALADRPGDREATAALCELYRRAGAAEPLARLLEADLAQRIGREEIELRLELAALLAESLGRAADALQHLRRVLELEPGHCVALESGFALAERLGRHEEILAFLDARLACERDDSVRAGLLSRRARLLAGPLERPEAAVPAYRQALRAAPSERALLQELGAVLQRLGRHRERLELLEAEHCAADAADRPGLLERGAELAAECVSQDASLPWLERLRGVRADDAGLLQRIASVHRAAGRAGALLRTLEAELALQPAPERQRELQLERASLLEHQLGLPLAAAEALEAAHDAAPDDAAVVARLADLYARCDQPRERARALATLVSRVEPSGRNHLRRELARLHRERLSEPEAACGWLEQALAHTRDGDVPRAELLRDLGAALAEAGRTRAAATAAEQELELLDPSDDVLAERRVELRRWLADCYAGELSDPDRECIQLRALLDGEAGRPPAAPPELADELEPRLLQHLRRGGGLVELAQRLRNRLEHRPDDLRGWLELARLHAEQLHRPACAAEAYEAVLRHRPGHLEAWRGLRRASERLGDWHTFARALDGELSHDPKPEGPQRAALLRRLAEVAWKRLGSTARASHALGAALEAQPGDLESLRTLEELREAMEDWRGALDVYEHEVETLGDGDPERRQQVWLRVAWLASERTRDTEKALQAFDAAAAISPLAPPLGLRHAEAARRCDRRERAAEILARWCDDPRSGASASDHLRLAGELQELGEGPAALARVERALELDQRSIEAWDLAARLRNAAGDRSGCAEALVRAGDLLPGPQAARRLTQAAEVLEEADPERTLELLRRAVECDPAAVEAQARLGLAAARTGDLETAQCAALAVLDLDVGQELPEGLRAQLALEGGRAAQRMGQLENATRLFRTVLAGEPGNAAALDGLGRILLQFGNYAEARPLLEQHLPSSDEHRRSDDLARLGRCLEHLGETEEALARFRESAELDPGSLEAHAGCVRVLASLDRPRELAWALHGQAEAWGPDEREAACSLTRAAETLLEARIEPDLAESWLERATRIDASPGRAWLGLAHKQHDEGREEELMDTLGRALAGVEEPSARAELASLLGRCLEARGERRAAAGAFREAVNADVRRLDDALASSRLFRALGEWREAASVLEAAGVQALEEDPRRAARVFHQLGRLLAGPLEDLAGSLRAYERALDCDPTHAEAELALADLLVHLPERRSECVARHRRILASNPLRVASLRAVVRLQPGRARSAGLTLLAAMGCATLEERGRASEAVPMPQEGGLHDPLFECARRVAQAVAREIALALGTATPDIQTRVDDPVARFRTRTLACAGELSAPALLPLATDELHTVLSVVAGLAAESDCARGSGRLVNALANALGRRARRRVKRVLDATTPEQIANLDYDRWRAELQALAASTVLRRKGGGLRTALLALLDESGGRPPDGSDLSALVEASPAASCLFGRLVAAWLASLDGA